jgi:large subunit ribosomal protein L29
MEMKELRNLDETELREKERQLVQEVFNLRFQVATGRVENPMKMRHTRRDLARVKTILREMAAAPTPPAGKSKG